MHQEMVQHLAHVLPTAYVKQMGRAQVLTISCLMNYIAIYKIFKQVHQTYNITFFKGLVNCAWGEWSAYTGCTKTCGLGKQYRYRAILTHDENGGTACVGTDNVEDQDCNTQSCSGNYATIFTELCE